MADENDTLAGGEELSLDEAATRYAALTSEPVTDQGDEEDAEDGDTPVDEAEDVETPEDEDGETGDEDQAEDDDEEPETEKGRFVADNAKVRLDDGTVVSIADLKKGSLLLPDYTRKTQEVAEQRRSVESQSQALQQHAQQLAQQRDYVAQLVQAFMPQPPDPSILDTDPHGYMRARSEYEQWTAHHQNLAAMAQAEQQQAQQREAQERKDREQREWNATLEKMPALKDETKLKGFIRDIEQHGLGYGFSKEEIANALTMDHRQALVLRDAMAWRKLQADKTKVTSKVEGRPPVQKGTRRLSPDGQKVRQQGAAMNRLKQTGRLDDAVAVYLANQKG